MKVDLKQEDLLSIIGEYGGLAVRSITAQVLEAASNLKVIGRAGIGVDNINVTAATARGIVVMNTPFGNTITTAERALALKTKVAAFVPFLSDERAKDLGIEKVEPDEMLAHADFITLHMPMTDQTRGMLDANALAKCKSGARIIDCARGGLVVEEALA